MMMTPGFVKIEFVCRHYIFGSNGLKSIAHGLKPDFFKGG
jgi:hypothetical protein